MSYEHFDDLDAFLAALTSRGVTGVGLRTVKEIRPVAEGRGIVVGHQEWCELRAYDKPTILTLKVVGQNPHALRARLEGMGLTVRAQSGNLT